MTERPPGPDDGAAASFRRQFVQRVLDEFPDTGLETEREGAGVVVVCASVVQEIPNFETDRECFTYGRWYGLIRVGRVARWAYWEVFDDDEFDIESDDRGRRVVLFDTEAEAAARYVDELVDACGFASRPAPEEWPDDDQERVWQQQRLGEYIERARPFWRALTGLPDDVISYCVEERSDPRSVRELTGGRPSPEEVEGLRLLAALRSRRP